MVLGEVEILQEAAPEGEAESGVKDGLKRREDNVGRHGDGWDGRGGVAVIGRPWGKKRRKRRRGKGSW